MEDLTLKIGDRESAIVVGHGSADALGPALAKVAGRPDTRSVAVVSDTHVAQLYADRVRHSLEAVGFHTCLYRVHPGETSKSPAALEGLYRFLLRSDLRRDGLLLALGGGVVSDLTGFAAATWMRGIDWVVCPTTLEAAIDAAIGGKTAINLPGGKNLVGAFHQPRLVVIDPALLTTLDPRDVRAGLAESIKHALIASAEFFTWHQQHVGAVLSLDEAVMSELIERNVRIKLDFVQRDPFERTGVRMLLNFGHTIGHAIEECRGYALRHGECVALGMLAACRLSRKLNLLAEADVKRIRTVLESYQLPTQLDERIPTDRVLEVLRRDKKTRGRSVRFVLLEDIGRPVVRGDVPEELIAGAFESLLP